MLALTFLELTTSLLGNRVKKLLARDLLELATSFLGARRLRQEKLLTFRKSFAGSHSNFPIDAAFKEVYNRVVNRFAN